MLNGTPCVILEGSGRIADVIAQVAGWPLARVTIALIHQLMSKFFGSEYNTFSALKIIEWTKKVQTELSPATLFAEKMTEGLHTLNVAK